MISDKTREEMREIIARYPGPRSAILPMLHLVQSEEGYVTPEGIEACAQELDLTPAEVSAVVTFYTMYKRHPVGEYHVGVCTNTLCAVMGGDAIRERLEGHLGIGTDETTDDGKISYEHIECNAGCDYAPVVMVNWEFVDDQTPESVVELVDDLRAGKERHSTRGGRLCPWRQGERVLAGFPDGRADEGVTAGPRSLVGLGIAHDRGWSADVGTDGDTGAATGDADTARAHHEGAQAEAGAGAGSGHPDERSDPPPSDTSGRGGDTPGGSGDGAKGKEA